MGYNIYRNERRKKIEGGKRLCKNMLREKIFKKDF
jgi:hypothetical protein